MGLSNYPPGMRESDIPGFNDVDCPVCHTDCTDKFGVPCWFCDGRGSVDVAEEREYYREQRY